MIPVADADADGVVTMADLVAVIDLVRDSPAAASTAIGPQARVALEHLEVPVGVEHEQRRPQRHHRDQAVGQRPCRLASATARPVQLGRRLEVVEPLDRHVLAAGKQAPQPVPVVVVAGAGQDLHDHHVGGVGGLVPVEEAPDRPMGGAAGGAEVLDPG